MKRIIYLFAVSVLISSCGTYKKYQRPEAIVCDSIFGTQYTSTDTASIADLGWRDLFADPHLQALIDSALTRNTDLRTAQLRVEQAMTGLRIARLGYLPTLNLVPEGSVGGFNNYSGLNTGASWTYNGAVAAGWELDIFGKKTAAKRRARASVDMTKDYEQAVKTGLIAGVATQYYTLLMLDEQLRIAESTLTKFKESVRVMRAMKEAGMANDVAVSQLEGAWYQVETAVEDLHRSISEVENSLSTTLCMAPHSIARGTLADATFPEVLSAGIPIAILSRRPDVRAAEHNLAAAFYGVAEAKANLYPSITLSGIAGWTNSLGTTVVDPAGLLLNAAASVVEPLFNAGALRGNVKIAKADYEVASLALQQTLLDAGAEVNNALTAYQTALAKEQWRTRQTASLANAARQTERLMQHTSTTYLEVLTAQQSLLEAETAQAADTYEKVTAVINLYRALGGGQF